MANKENKILQTIRITREEWNDYQMMRDFIFDNELGVKFMLYEDVVNQMKEETLRQNDENHRTDTNLLN